MIRTNPFHRVVTSHPTRQSETLVEIIREGEEAVIIGSAVTFTVEEQNVDMNVGALMGGINTTTTHTHSIITITHIVGADGGMFAEMNRKRKARVKEYFDIITTTEDITSFHSNGGRVTRWNDLSLLSYTENHNANGNSSDPMIATVRINAPRDSEVVIREFEPIY